MSELQYTSVDRIISKFHRDLRGTDVNESDMIEWIGEALEFLKVPQIQDQAIAFIEVKNHHAEIPKGFQMVLQIARNNHWEEKKDICTPKVIIDEITETNEDCLDCGPCSDNILVTDCNGFILDNNNIIDYKPQFDLKLNYQYWKNSSYYKRQYTPVRLANHTLFNSIVCKEKVDDCIGCIDEYTIVGTTEKRIRCSFENGQIAMSYLKNAIDEETGYPLVPDQISYITAISYYIKWKIAEWYSWSGRDGFEQKADKAQQNWTHYVKQAKNWAKMPKSIDDYQDLLEQTHYLIPNHKKYYGFFGNLGKSQELNFNKHNTEYKNHHSVISPSFVRNDNCNSTIIKNNTIIKEDNWDSSEW